MKALAVVAVLVGSLSVGCATYRDDLDRATVHYHANEYAASLVLLEVLQPDIDSLSVGERARYAYYRGMSHFRLNQRRDARHWLGVASAREKANEGSLSKEEKKRVDDILAELNADRWGGATTPAAEGGEESEEKEEGGAEPAAADEPPGEGEEEAPAEDNPQDI